MKSIRVSKTALLSLLLSLCVLVPASASAPGLFSKEDKDLATEATKKFSLWHLFGKKQKIYLFSYTDSHSSDNQYIYSYDGLVWKKLTDAQGRSVMPDLESVTVARSIPMKEYPSEVATLGESNPQCMKMGPYTCIYWNKLTRCGAIRTKKPKKGEWEDFSNLTSFPANIQLGELYEVSREVFEPKN